MRKILIFRIGLLGDTVVSLPAFKTIRENFPQAEITLLYEKTGNLVGSYDLMAYTGLIDKSIPYITGAGIIYLLKLWAKLRGLKFDAVIILPPSRRSRYALIRDKLFFLSAGIKKHFGFKWPYSAEYTPDSAFHETDFLLRLLVSEGLTLSKQLDLVDMLIVPESDKRICESVLNSVLKSTENGLLFAFCVGSNMPAKCWPLENYFLLGERLISQFGVIPIIFGGPKEKEIGDILLKKWGCGLNLAGRFTVIQSYYLLRKCRLYVGNDTGVMHLAVLAGLKCIAIFSARDVKGRWDPYGAGHIVARKNVPCQGCMLVECVDKNNMCVATISVDEVFGACANMLRNAIK